VPLPGPSGVCPGGLLALEYSNPTMGERHNLHLHLAWFDQDPGTDNDRAYVGGGPVAPAESGVLATFAAIAALWAPYYEPDWSLHINELYLNSSGDLIVLPNTPIAAPVLGTNATDPPGLPRVNRIFRLLGQRAARRDMWICQVPGVTYGVKLEVSGGSGGFDARDQAWMAYLAGASGGGVVMPDGTYAHGVADVRAWWARRLEPVPVGSGEGGGGDGGGAMLSDGCLVLPLDAHICNPVANVVTLTTPGGSFAFDETGLTLPGGHRLEVV
jgi:hypothetical protein